MGWAFGPGPSFMRKTAVDRFLGKVERIPMSGCWVWLGFVTKDGHGKFFLRGVMPTAHRCSWMLFRGEIPSGMCVLHKCDVASCVNPDHLYLGTNDDNVRDRVVRGRSAPVDKENAPNSKLTQEKVDEIRKRYETGDTQAALSSMFQISRSQVGNIVNRRQWA